MKMNEETGTVEEFYEDICLRCQKDLPKVNDWLYHDCWEILNEDHSYPEALWDMDEDIPEYIVENGIVRKTR